MDCQTVFVSKSILTLVTAAWPLSIVGGLMDFAHTVIMNFVPVDGVLDLWDQIMKYNKLHHNYTRQNERFAITSYGGGRNKVLSIHMFCFYIES